MGSDNVLFCTLLFFHSMLYLGDTFLLAYGESAHSVSRAGWYVEMGQDCLTSSMLTWCCFHSIAIRSDTSMCLLAHLSLCPGELFLYIKSLRMQLLESTTIYTFKEDTYYYMELLGCIRAYIFTSVIVTDTLLFKEVS